MKGELIRILYNPKTKEYEVKWSDKNQSTNLVCDTETHIVYYYLSHGHMSYMSPYLSENGKYCRYNAVFGRIEEIN